MIYPVLAAILLCSCTVKEDRGPCPSRLTVDASAFRDVSDVAFVSLTTETQSLKDTLYLDSGDMEAVWEANKGLMTAYAFSNVGKGREKDGVVTIPPGEEADPLRAFCHRFECYEELAGIEAVPNRQSALVHLRVLNVEGSYPYELQVSGDVCGIDLKTLSPLEGEYRHWIRLDEGLTCEFHLPRQGRWSRAVIDVFLDGTCIDSLPLHSWIDAAGYDWTLDDLPDIHIDIVHGLLQVFINIQGWEHEDYEVVL